MAGLHRITKIVSGGQTGVDRAALDFAIANDVSHGGWCPLGRLAEDGRIGDRYQLQELDSPDYATRTERNVIDSDGTLILYRQKMKGGTLLTHRLAKRHSRPCLAIRMDRVVDYSRILAWLDIHAIETLNVAGPRLSSSPGIDDDAHAVLTNLWQQPGRLPGFE